MAHPVLANGDARKLFLHRHALLERPVGPARGAALAQLLERLGFVQVDSVNTLARAHDLILWSRRNTYRPAALRALNDRVRASFEHWTHDAAIIPMVFYPYWRLRFERDRARLHERWKSWHGPAFHGEIDRVLAHVAAEGPVASGDLADRRPAGSSGWWDWHPSKTALEYLWRSGDLAVTRREGFRKIYDLSERVIPPAILDGPRPDLARTVDWACSAALDRLGFATPGEIAAFWDLITPEEAKAWVGERLRSGELLSVDVEGASGGRRRSVMRASDLGGLGALPDAPSRMRILSPFDPALRDRKRAERLFGFAYRIEIFVPEARRRYGYYVFPVLEGTRLVGRIDMAALPGRETLEVRAFWPERGVRMGRARCERLIAELERIACLAGCARIEHKADWLRSD
jgi:uncharacterized protein YcaQ